MLIVQSLAVPSCQEGVYGLQAVEAWRSFFRGPLFIVCDIFVLIVGMSHIYAPYADLLEFIAVESAM